MLVQLQIADVVMIFQSSFHYKAAWYSVDNIVLRKTFVIAVKLGCFLLYVLLFFILLIKEIGISY